VNYAFLWALIGWGLASWVIVILTLPDPPPPDLWGRFVRVGIAGIVGGIAGGAIARALVGSDPMPLLTGSTPMPGIVLATLVGAAAGALVIGSGVAIAGRTRAAR